MTRPEVQWSSATHEADWIGARLDPLDGCTVGSVIPRGFEACARLLHPAHADDGERVVRWAQVAAWSGGALARDVQFQDIALRKDGPPTPAPWQRGPDEGSLDADDARRLVDILAEHTAAPESCWFALWDGYGQDGAVLHESACDEADGIFPDLIDPVPADVRAGPRVELPDREFLLYAGPVEAALAFTTGYDQTPNLWWSADRSWCVASDLDLQWTYVAGSTAVVEQILGDPLLEALPAQAEDSTLMRLTGWLTDAVEEAVSQLLDTGRAQILTAHGTVDAHVGRSGRWRRRWLQIECTTKKGGSAGSEAAFRPRSGRSARAELRDELVLAVTTLADL